MATEHADPEITICLATRNRARLLEQTLLELERQCREPIAAEVIVVDNGSQDETPELLDRFRARLPLTVLHEAQPGKNRCLNRALKVARGRLLVFTDDDVLLEEGWLRELYGMAERWREDDVFCGPVIPLYPPGMPEALRTLPLAAPAFCRYEPAREEGPVVQSPFGANFAIRASLLANYSFCESIGPGDGNYAMGAETELFSRLRRAGTRFIFTPRARVRHVIRDEQLTEQWLLGRAFRYGRGMHRYQYHNKRRPVFASSRLQARTLQAWVKYLAHWPRPGPGRIEAGWDFHYLRGLLHEARQASIPRAGTD